MSRTPEEFERLMLWMERTAYTYYGESYWVAQGDMFDPETAHHMAETSLTPAECYEALERLANTGYWPQLVYDDDGHWQLSMQGGAQIDGGCITVFCEDNMWFATIHEAIEASILALIAAEKEATADAIRYGNEMAVRHEW